MNVILDGRIIELPDSVKGNDLITQWQNCIYVYDVTTKLGKVYFKKDGFWTCLASNIRSYYVNKYSFSMPYLSPKNYFAVFTTEEDVETYLLNCVTGQVIFKAQFEVNPSVMYGIGENLNDTCFILKVHTEDSVKYVMFDGNGKGYSEHIYGTLSFLTQKNYGGAWPILLYNSQENRLGMVLFFKEKANYPLSSDYNAIQVCDEAVIDKKGHFHYPIVKVQKEKKEQILDLNGKVIQM